MQNSVEQFQEDIQVSSISELIEHRSALQTALLAPSSEVNEQTRALIIGLIESINTELRIRELSAAAKGDLDV